MKVFKVFAKSFEALQKKLKRTFQSIFSLCPGSGREGLSLPSILTSNNFSLLLRLIEKSPNRILAMSFVLTLVFLQQKYHLISIVTCITNSVVINSITCKINVFYFKKIIFFHLEKC